MKPIIPVGFTSTSIPIIMNSIVIPILEHYSLAVYLNPEDLTSRTTYDPEYHESFHVVEWNDHWLGGWGSTDYELDLKACAKAFTGELYNWGLKDDEVRYELTKAEHRLVVELLMSIYDDITSKLEADIQHNLFRAHHQGTYIGGNLDKSAVIRGIERYLAKVRRATVPTK